ncbi:MAG: hypothetical protein QXM31_02590 [Candidatus Woesearchaeota archaeon]
MKKVIVLAAILMILVLTACGGNQMQAKPLSARTPTAAATSPEPAPAPTPEPAPTMTAAQAIKELQEQMQSAPATTSTGPKTATTGLPPAPKGLTGKDALLARTHALYSTGSEVPDSMLTGGVVRDLPKLSNE